MSPSIKKRKNEPCLAAKRLRHVFVPTPPHHRAEPQRTCAIECTQHFVAQLEERLRPESEGAGVTKFGLRTRKESRATENNSSAFNGGGGNRMGIPNQAAEILPTTYSDCQRPRPWIVRAATSPGVSARRGMTLAWSY